MPKALSHRVILIGGPTASGKSAMAMRLARQENGAIINADAMQVYAGLPLLTAQPSQADKDEIPHYLYEITDATEASSAGKWLALAHQAIEQVRADDRLPILVGGTGMYFNALLGGLADIPAIPDSVRQETERLYVLWGEEKFRTTLATQDPESANRIARNDRQRLIRAYEVATHTGKNLGAWQKASDNAYPENIRPEFHLIMPPRDVLYAACDRRFQMMIDKGAIEEVQTLTARNLPPALPAMKVLGVPEIAAYLKGDMKLDQAIAKAQQKTRNYAKRQMTWFRNQWKNIKLEN